MCLYKFLHHDIIFFYSVKFWYIYIFEYVTVVLGSASVLGVRRYCPKTGVHSLHKPDPVSGGDRAVWGGKERGYEAALQDDPSSFGFLYWGAAMGLNARAFSR